MVSIADVRRILGQMRSEFMNQTEDRPLNMAKVVDGTTMSLSEWAFECVYKNHKKRQHKACKAGKARSG